MRIAFLAAQLRDALGRKAGEIGRRCRHALDLRSDRRYVAPKAHSTIHDLRSLSSVESDVHHTQGVPVKTKAKLFAALALVVMTGFFNPVGVPQAMAQASVQVAGQEALNAVNAALKAGQITQAAANTLTKAINGGATVAVQGGTLVIGGANAALAAGAVGTLAAANVAVVALIVAGVAVAVSGDGTTATTGTTGTQ